MRSCCNKSLSFVLVVGAFCLLVQHAFCFKALAKEGEKKLQTFTLTGGSEPAGLDPHTIVTEPATIIVAELFEGLVANHPKTLEIVPAVAKRWQVLDKGLKYVFYLRENAKWSNGKPLTAKDFVYSWRRVLSPSTASPVAYFLYPIKGAKDYNEGKSKDVSSLGIKALSNYVLEVTLEYPTAYFLKTLAVHPFYPVYQETVEKYGAKWIQPKNLVGNGPFTLAAWKPNVEIVLRRNSFYWDTTNVQLDQIRILPITSVDTAFNMYEAGALDFNSATLPTARVPYLKKRKDFYTAPYLGTYFYRFNSTKYPFNDARVRKALSLSIDRKLLVERVLRGGQRPAYAFTPPGIGNYVPPKTDKFSPSRARRIFGQLGFCAGKQTVRKNKSCKPFPKFSILITNREIHRKIALAIAGMWKEHLGIGEVTLNNQEWKVYLGSLRELNYQVSFGSWLGDYLDPTSFLQIWTSGNPNNRTGWKNPAFDSLIEQSLRGLKQNRRNRLFRRAEALLLDELPMTPIYQLSKLYLLKPHIKGIYPNLLHLHPFKYVSVVNK